MKQRAKDLGLDIITDEQIKAATISIKNLSDTRYHDHSMLAVVHIM